MERFLRARFQAAEWGALDFEERSCEHLATLVLEALPGLRRVTVWEDMENAGGAER